MTKTTTITEAARDYVRRGFRPIPVPRGQKGPKLSGWQRIAMTEEEVPSFFPDGYEWNIGLILGAGVVDVDCDTPEATEAARFVLPHTGFVYGRKSKPRSHYFFSVNDVTLAEKFNDPTDKQTLVELRALKQDGSTGLQSIVPPSLHPTGETIGFDLDGMPALIDGAELKRLVRRIAAMAVLARHWAEKDRHEAGLALAGALANAGMPDEDVMDFVVGMYQCVATHDRSAIARTEAEVHDTLRKHTDGEAHTGFPKLCEAVSDIVARKAFEWLGLEGRKETGWTAQLSYNARTGRYLGSLKNAMVALRESPDWKGRLRFNEFTLKIETAKPAPWGETVREWADHHDVRVCEWLDRSYEISVRKDVAASAVDAVARENPCHPVRDYLSGLKWDGKERLPRLLPDYFCAQDSRCAQEISRKWMISAVARVFQPGCQADHVLVLEGKQGIGKSSGLRALFDQWFTDDIAEIGTKDAQLGTAGVWCVELSEMAAITRRETETVKAFVSRRVDRFRAPYDRRLAEHPRQCVFAATTNEHEFLKDATGARRFWPFEVHKVDRNGLVVDRDQLWAEAVAAYRAGEPWHITEAEAELLVDIQTAQAERAEHDLWHEPIAAYVEKQIEAQNAFTLAELLEHGVGKDVKHCDARDTARVSRVMRQLGYVPKQERGGGRRRYWTNHDRTPVFRTDHGRSEPEIF